MAIAVGDIIEGKVMSTTHFGAFVSLPEGENGLIHISEISNEYVKEVEDFVQQGQDVRVKVLTIKDGKVGLSLKALEAKKEPRVVKTKSVEWSEPAKNHDLSFEDKLSQFLKDSNEKYDQLRSRDGKKKSHKSRSRY